MRRSIKSILALLLVVATVFGVNGVQLFAAPNYVTATRTLSQDTMYIGAGEEVEVKLGVTGTPPVNVVKPNDVVLVLDKSGSMKDDNRFQAMIESAKEFVDLFDFSAHQVGIVDFSFGHLTNTYPLSTDPAAIKSYLDTIQLYGGTDTEVAIRRAMEVLTGGREEAQPVIVLLTDGEANNMDAARQAAEEAKNAGIVFYTIALLGPNEDPAGSAANDLMQDMATTAHHHHFVLGSVGLIDIYRAIVKEIGIASAYDVVITEKVAPQFEIVPGSYEHNIPQPTVNGNTLTWDILELKANTLELSYKVKLKSDVVPGNYMVGNSSNITYKDYAGANRTYVIPNKSITVKHKTPIIHTITPNQGDIAGGNTATITGENFRQGVTVKFGANLATDVTMVDDKTLTVTVPAGAYGNALVTVTNDDGQKATTNYNYTATPIISSITPNKGEMIGGNSVSIKGQYISKDAKVYFDGIEASVKTATVGREIIVAAPASEKVGTVDVKLENPDGTQITVAGGYEYVAPPEKPAPTITGINPNSAQVGVVQNIIIEGTGFQKGAVVTIGDIDAPILNYYSENRIQVRTPASDTPGKVDVVLTNPDSKTVTVTEGYEYLPLPEAEAPTITSISPNSAQVGVVQNVYVEGTGFQRGLTITVGGENASVLNYYNANRLQVRIPVGVEVGKVDVVLTNPDGKNTTAVEGYEYLPLPEAEAPTITNISPNTVDLGKKQLVYIDGTGFQKGLEVTVNGQSTEMMNYYSSKRIQIRVEASDIPGKVDVVLTNPDGKNVTVTEGYEYLAPPEEQDPVITALSAESGQLPGGELIYVEGANFKEGIQVFFGTNEAEVNRYYGPTKLAVKVPTGDIAGAVDVRVVNPSGKEATLVGGYTYNKYVPEIINLTATSGKLVGGEKIYINGKNFDEGIVVQFASEEAKVITRYNPTRLYIEVPAAISAGVVDVTVINPDGESYTLADAYEYMSPPAEIAPELTKLTVSASATAVEAVSIAKGKMLYAHGLEFKTNHVVKIVDATGVEHIEKPNRVYDSKKLYFRMPAAVASGEATVTIINQDSSLESNAVTITVN